MKIDLSGKRVLVVEDMYLIAADLTRALEEAGAQVVGPAGTLPYALELAQGSLLDAALLDINLDGQPCFAIAEALEGRNVPYLFLTGYDGAAIPGDYQTTPRLAKPCSMPVVLGAVAKLCSPPSPVLFTG